MTERIRTTISLTPEALHIFQRMAEAANMSVSRCMGDWLNDTADAAEMVMLKMEEVKVAPMRVMREMRSLVAGLGAAVIETEEEVRQLRADSDRRAPRRAAGVPVPPSSNTGVLVPPSPPKSSNRVKRSTKNRKLV